MIRTRQFFAVNRKKKLYFLSHKALPKVEIKVKDAIVEMFSSAPLRSLVKLVLTNQERRVRFTETFMSFKQKAESSEHLELYFPRLDVNRTIDVHQLLSAIYCRKSD
ncbi:hypothetical protein RRG08_022003 [Elysia crispata]|uniref:Uncharacterized protein n=1 Tax=Elysia crispata TaxID=231223 RepID=A0AAE1A919_9GAST|nr:hypothetical protein RRG08_022003 [Elysia crispata]